MCTSWKSSANNAGSSNVETNGVLNKDQMTYYGKFAQQHNISESIERMQNNIN